MIRMSLTMETADAVGGTIDYLVKTHLLDLELSPALVFD